MSIVNFTRQRRADETARSSAARRLLRYLRDDAGLVGTKDGCTTGDCGSCVVLVDGKPVDSCVHLMRRVDGTSVETIEALAEPDDRLHPIQAAFLDRGRGAVRLLHAGDDHGGQGAARREPGPDHRGDPPRPARQHLPLHRLRARSSRPSSRPPSGSPTRTSFAKWEPTYGPMGTSSVLIDGVRSVQGRLGFADDLALPGMLQGTVVWSQHAYARLVSVDVSDARRAPGVHKVVTAADVPGLNAHGRHGRRPARVLPRLRPLHRRPDRPRSGRHARPRRGRAQPSSRSSTRRCPGCSPRLRRSPRMPRSSCRPRRATCASSSPTRSATSTPCSPTAANVVEGHFTTQRQDHAYLEPLVCLAEVGSDGTVTVHTPTQAPFETREQLVKVLDLPREKIRIIATPLGGGFGGKLEIALEAMASVAAYVTRRPVKITLGREESLQTSVKRHPYEMDYRVAADDDGTLLAVEAVLIADGGPYTGNSPRVIDQACIFSCGPYRVPEPAHPRQGGAHQQPARRRLPRLRHQPGGGVDGAAARRAGPQARPSTRSRSAA